MKKILFLCSVGLALHVAAFCQHFSTTPAAKIESPSVWATQASAAAGPVVFQTPGGTIVHKTEKSAHQTKLDAINLYLSNTSYSRLYVFIYEVGTLQTVFFDVFEPGILSPIYIGNIEAGNYDVEVGDFDGPYMKFVEVGCESAKTGYVVNWSNIGLSEGCNYITVSGF